MQANDFWDSLYYAPFEMLIQFGQNWVVSVSCIVGPSVYRWFPAAGQTVYFHYHVVGATVERSRSGAGWPNYLALGGVFSPIWSGSCSTPVVRSFRYTGRLGALSALARGTSAHAPTPSAHVAKTRRPSWRGRTIRIIKKCSQAQNEKFTTVIFSDYEPNSTDYELEKELSEEGSQPQ